MEKFGSGIIIQDPQHRFDLLDFSCGGARGFLRSFKGQQGGYIQKLGFFPF
jgi:hypothetical protein